ncbi:MAG: DEAD/DEAH box helicase [Deltaproteobacteria bacterium GWC2_42_51]|nr:MAG: DEAD/DEAH box helicase [Deltaproteobacteria bacterium GWB2_42_7]OGP32981.1 MAG: DEAD/DEAH box helicase [Deltaproteobacteria bacterium GWC2_42_51]OGQ74020.1 MAG: DEAD/DEAH box helicase [Deltaproteobacteria bacterium RIFOXYA2_FULL_42_10]HAG50655.1 DEAD/DEAH box helicase [Deltaproteobacteria bacterium]HCY19497.1 DEAD/DEAH box helicase [Deltaproteobacteria bacterium]
MKLHFDSNQEYQIEAIRAVTDLFEGQPLSGGDFEFSLTATGVLLSENGVGNRLTLTEEQVWENVQRIQQRNEITSPPAPLLENERGEFRIPHGMNFSVEMETGTGKTYVYLRTIYELNKLYGFKKFVIVVPSIAIREGVLKNLQITYEHFQSLYDKTQINYDVYDSKKVSNLRGFACNNSIQILVINIDSFAKDENIINKPNDKLTGKKPIEFLQSTNPIVIVDEPQNMETEVRKKAIANLNPLCTLRYSATHTNLYNLVYSLNPVKAYDLGLVKQIEVDSVVSENAMNEAFIQLEGVKAAKTKITAKIKIDYNTNKGVVKKSITVKAGDDIYRLSNEREIYKEGFIIDEVDAGSGAITLTNGLTLSVGETQGGMNDEVMKFMLCRTVEEHFKKEKFYKGKGIKILSLFFIDRVKNYREYDANGNPAKGKFAGWFEEIYRQEAAKPVYGGMLPYEAHDVHNGYFSQDNKGRVKDTEGESQADYDTYKLIMQDKEKLLDPDTPLRFIFSHSALREGWDNPNVFQICTLNETKSEIKKRQEIGRGLRLPVNQNGERIFDRNINKLTVVANERYEDFAKALQKEIQEDCGVDFSGRIKNRYERQKVNFRKGFEADPKFLEIWEKIKFQTRYSVEYKTDELIAMSAKEIKNMPETKKPAIKSTKKRVVITQDGIDGQLVSDSVNDDYELRFEMPDMLTYIQSKTELTRHTILKILKKSGRLSEALFNPQLFMDNAAASVKSALYELMVDGIKYEKIGDKVYEMTLFDDKDFEIYLDEFTHHVKKPEKTVYENYIPLDSSVENKFAKDCESSENIEFFFKLPFWFRINTPIGTYNPDWAIVFKGEKKIYFVAETKGEGQELRGSEKLKIKCGAEHFKKFEDVVYKRVSSVSELNGR